MIRPGKDLSWKDFGKTLYKEWDEDSLADTAAALTFYGILSLFPFLLFLVSLASLLLDPKITRQLVDQLAAFAPGQVTQVVSDRLNALMQNQSTGLLTVGIVGAIWSASGAITSLTQALNRCYDVKETRPWWKLRLIGLLATLFGGVIAILAALITFAVPALGKWIGGTVGDAIQWLRFPVAGVIVMALWGLLYWALPNVRPKFQLVTPGSAAGVLVWLAASWGFSEYVGHSNSYTAEYGAIGGVIVLLVWMWLSSMVVLVGAEINKVLTPARALKYESEAGEGRHGGKEPPVVARPKDETGEKAGPRNDARVVGRPDPSHA